IDDDEGVMERPAADVGQRQHLEQAPVQHLLDDLVGDDGSEGVEDRLRPGAHLLVLAAWEIAELLAAYRIQRPEDYHLAVLAALHHRLETRAQRQGAL